MFRFVVLFIISVHNYFLLHNFVIYIIFLV